MIHPPAVIIHSLAHATVALAPGLPVTLLSARGAALYAGCLWWHTMVEEARRRHPHVRMTHILDCLNGAGRAMAALRMGQTMLILDPCHAWSEVAAAAAACDATLFNAPPPALDLAEPGSKTRLRDWLLRFGDFPHVLS